jgi:hypothetical protein
MGTFTYPTERLRLPQTIVIEGGGSSRAESPHPQVPLLLQDADRGAFLDMTTRWAPLRNSAGGFALVRSQAHQLFRQYPEVTQARLAVGAASTLSVLLFETHVGWLEFSDCLSHSACGGLNNVWRTKFAW